MGNVTYIYSCEIHAKYIIIVKDMIKNIGIAIGYNTHEEYVKAIEQYKAEQNISVNYKLIAGYES